MSPNVDVHIMSKEYFGFNSTQEHTLRGLLGAGTAGSIDTTDLAAGAVTAPKLANDAVTNVKVASGAAIAASKLAVAAGTSGLAATDVQASLQAAYLAIANLNAWATALATKLNADAGVTDVNYDTTPQS